MGLFDTISKWLIDPVDTSGAEASARKGKDASRALLQPGISANQDALARIAALLNDPDSFQGTPGFQFAMDQGVQARDRSAAARGQIGSGGLQKELTAFGTGLAQQDRGNEIARFLQFIGQTNPNVRHAALNENQLGQDLAGLQIGAENARVGTSSGLMSAMASLAGAGIGAFSDRRLKRDIDKVGQLPDGINLYRFRYLWDNTPMVGVMAQEVEKTKPGAVSMGQGGFMVVDYSQLGIGFMTHAEWESAQTEKRV